MENEQLMYLLQDRENTAEDEEKGISAILSEQLTSLLQSAFATEHRLFDSMNDGALTLYAENKLREMPNGRAFKIESVETYHDFKTYKKVATVHVKKKQPLARGKRGVAGTAMFDEWWNRYEDQLRGTYQHPLYFNIGDREVQVTGLTEVEEGRTDNAVAETTDYFIARHYEPEPTPTRDVETFRVVERYGMGVLMDNPTTVAWARPLERGETTNGQ